MPHLKDNKVYLNHILDEIIRIESFLEDWTQNEFTESNVTANHYAIVRSFEIIGEAASKVSPDFHTNHPEIPWRSMIDMRNKIIHEYLSVDYQVVWETATQDIPKLKNMIEKLLE